MSESPLTIRCSTHRFLRCPSARPQERSRCVRSVRATRRFCSRCTRPRANRNWPRCRGRRRSRAASRPGGSTSRAKLPVSSFQFPVTSRTLGWLLTTGHWRLATGSRHRAPARLPQPRHRDDAAPRTSIRGGGRRQAPPSLFALRRAGCCASTSNASIPRSGSTSGSGSIRSPIAGFICSWSGLRSEL